MSISEESAEFILYLQMVKFLILSYAYCNLHSMWKTEI